jgi:DUF2934 family protein
MTYSVIASVLTAEGVLGKFTGGHERPSPDEISRLAYDLYEKRGRRDGHDVDDWLSAEQELRHHYQ